MKFTTQQLRLQMISDKQSVYCFTAYAQSVLLLVECNLRRGRHCLIGDRPVNDLVVKLLPLFNQMSDVS